MATASSNVRTPPPCGESSQVASAGGVWFWAWAALLSAFFLYVWLRVDPAFVYQAHWVQPAASEGVPVFRFSAPFLAERVSRPGGPAEVAAAFLSQYHQFPWLGAAIITVLAALLCAEAFVLASAFGGEAPRLLHLAPALLLLAIYAYYFDPLPDALALALSLACACLYVRLGRPSAPARLVVFLAVLVPLWYATAGASLVYVLLCALFDLTSGRRGLALLSVALGGAVPYGLGAVGFHVGPAESLWRLLPFHLLLKTGESARALVIKRSLLESALYAFYPLAAIGAFAARRLDRHRRRLRLVGAVVLAALAGGVCAMHDGEMKAETAVDYYAYRRMWPEVLENARKVPFGTYGYLFVNCAVNRALFHMGKLADEMFAYRQDPVGQMLCEKTLASLVLQDRACAMQADMLLDLGCVNQAEQMACEAIQALGEHPRLLELVAVCNLAKGRTGAARILLRAASTDPVQGGRARELLRRMEDDPLLADDPQLQRIRALRTQEDVAGSQEVEEGLKALLAQNSRNRMAFEYLMGRYLVYGSLDKFVNEIGRLDGLGYGSIPRSYEEALLVYAAETGRTPDLGGRSISVRTRERFTGFGREMVVTRWLPLESRLAALSNYADTYMYYYYFLLPKDQRQ
jgi:hypothetical protein